MAGLVPATHRLRRVQEPGGGMGRDSCLWATGTSPAVTVNLEDHAMDKEPLKIVQEGDVLWVTLNRPQRLNALSRQLVEDLRELFVGLYWRHDIRAVVLSGAGSNFCAGLDLKERGSNTANTPGNGLVSQRKISEIVIAMRRCPQPIIALMDGSASGGGVPPALANDMRIPTPIAP